MAWLPVVTLILGSALTFIAGLLSEMQRNRVVERRLHLERRTKMIEERNSFQRETLLSLQEAGVALLEATTVVHDRKCEVFSHSGQWVNEEEVDYGIRQERRRARLAAEVLAVRIIDDDLRSSVKQVLVLETAISKCETSAIADATLNEMRDNLEVLNDQLGVVLRRLL